MNPNRIKKPLSHRKQKNWRKVNESGVRFTIVINNIWTIVDELEDKQVLLGKWVYKVKYRADGQLDKFKARYVANGYAQIEGLDFSIRTLQHVTPKLPGSF